MAEDKDKPVRVQFGKEMDNKGIVDAIREIQDKWAKEHPKIAHEKYPKRYAADGSVIPGAGK